MKTSNNQNKRLVCGPLLRSCCVRLLCKSNAFSWVIVEVLDREYLPRSKKSVSKGRDSEQRSKVAYHTTVLWGSGEEYSIPWCSVHLPGAPREHAIHGHLMNLWSQEVRCWTDMLWQWPQEYSWVTLGKHESANSSLTGRGTNDLSGPQSSPLEPWHKPGSGCLAGVLYPLSLYSARWKRLIAVGIEIPVLSGHSGWAGWD
jgi:hypothetical protein